MTGSFANEDVMEEYLAALLTDDVAVKKDVTVKKEDTVQKQSVARLLEEVHPVVTEVKKPVAPKPVEPVIETPLPVPEPQVSQDGGQGDVVDDNRIIEGNFQALFFSVAGLTLAVPLTELGGIHNLEKPGPLFGKPEWFMGVMLHREEKLNVVDTAKWVMPEKCNEILEDSLKYQYLIMLGDSGWGLACEELVNTVTLQSEDVKWRDMDGRRPWLAGMVKEKMCAMLDVKQLIDMLNNGLGSNG